MCSSKGMGFDNGYYDQLNQYYGLSYIWRFIVGSSKMNYFVIFAKVMKTFSEFVKDFSKTGH